MFKHFNNIKNFLTFRIFVLIVVLIFAVLLYFLTVTLISQFVLRITHFYCLYYWQFYFPETLAALSFSNKFTSLEKFLLLSLLHIYQLIG